MKRPVEVNGMSLSPSRLRLTPEDIAADQLEVARKLVAGGGTLGRLNTAGVEVATTPKDPVLRLDNAILYHYRPLVDRPFRIPVLITYAFFNRYYMIDLDPDRSLVRALLELGIDLYVIDWGYPRRSDRWLTIDDFVSGHIQDCVDFIRDAHALNQVNLLGICQGGAWSLCYAALHPEKVKNLIVMVTPVDFEADQGTLGRWIKALDADRLVAAQGNINGDFVSLGFLMRSPFERHIKKYLDLVDILDDERKMIDFLRMEKWIFDSPDQCGEAFRQWVKDFYQGNKLIRGELELGGRLVDLSRVTMPVLNVYGEQDDIIPPESAAPLDKYVGTKDYLALHYPVGHIGMYVSSKVRRDLPAALARWLKKRK
jgi:polyhydroxyalkanoate synthase subunit PhaC